MRALFVYVVCPNKTEARKIAKAAVEARLAACANIMAGHESVYWWDGKIQNGKEVAVIFKTRAALFEKLKKKILSLHGYECPCIVALPIEKGHAGFLKWIEAETSSLLSSPRKRGSGNC